MQMPRAKVIVRTFPAWGDRKAVGGAAGSAALVTPVRVTSQTGGGLGTDQFDFLGRVDVRFSSFGRGTSGWHGGSGGGQFARRSRPRAQYDGGRPESYL
jgi:hypothetical protein